MRHLVYLTFTSYIPYTCVYTQKRLIENDLNDLPDYVCKKNKKMTKMVNIQRAITMKNLG